MKCPKCGDKSEVLQTLQVKGGTNRRRKCLNPHCEKRFTTMESDALIEKRQISPDKLLAKLKGKKRKPGSSFDPEAVEAALRTDARRAELKRDEKYRHKHLLDYDHWDSGAWDRAPSSLTQETMRKEIDGYY